MVLQMTVSLARQRRDILILASTIMSSNHLPPAATPAATICQLMLRQLPAAVVP